jgi:putative endonuclease
VSAPPGILFAVRDSVWRGGEQAAWEAYRRRGFRLLARNWRCPLGELDLVVAAPDLVVFCEVKARSSPALGGGYGAVTPAKQRKLRRLAEAFIAAERPTGTRYRFDVASVAWNDRGLPSVHVFEDAF